MSLPVGTIPLNMECTRQLKDAADFLPKGCLTPPRRKIGNILRPMLLPWTQHPVNGVLLKHQRVAHEAHQQFEQNIPRSLGVGFSVRDIDIKIRNLAGVVSHLFTMRAFQGQFEDKKLCLLVFSLRGNRQFDGNGEKEWDPKTMGEMGDGLLAVLEALKSNKVLLDSAIPNSFGNAVLFKALEGTQDCSFLPRLLILNRAFPSTEKAVANQYSSLIGNTLVKAAQFSGLYANPEKGLVDFLQREKSQNLSRSGRREVVIIEAKEDHYFSKKGALASDLHLTLQTVGCTVSRIRLFVGGLHVMAQHSIRLGALIKNRETEEFVTPDPLMHYGPGESTAAAVARLMLRGDAHTSLIITGNDGTLALEELRTAKDLIEAWKKEAASQAEQQRSQIAS